MKNSIKYSCLALAIAASATACSGDRGGQHNDSLKGDTSVLNSSDNRAATPGSNGSAISADTGLDKSGNGGGDTTKTP